MFPGGGIDISDALAPFFLTLIFHPLRWKYWHIQTHSHFLRAIFLFQGTSLSFILHGWSIDISHASAPVFFALSFILHGGSIGIYRRIHTVHIPPPFFWRVFVFHPSRLKHGHISCIRTCIVIIDTDTLCRVVFSRLQLHRCRQSPVSMHDSNVVCSVLYFCRRLNCRVTNTILYLSRHYWLYLRIFYLYIDIRHRR